MDYDIPDRDDIQVKSILASNTRYGSRIDTLQLRYPRIIHSEFMTHRAFSRNASSSRAIPTASILVRDEEMFVPNFRHNKPGMQPGVLLSTEQQAEADAIWREMARACIEGSQKLAAKDGLNIHKQWTNRPLEWFGYIDVVVSATDWENFDHLRDHFMAQDEIMILCRKMKEARDNAVVHELRPGQWHLPYFTLEDEDYVDFNFDPMRPELIPREYIEGIEPIFNETNLWTLPPAQKMALVISAARCCRVSYSKHDGTPSTVLDDMDRFLKLVPLDAPVHATPLEHQATPLDDWDNEGRNSGNLRGFNQFRKFIPNEAVYG